jgi:hypothetical protein
VTEKNLGGVFPFVLENLNKNSKIVKLSDNESSILANKERKEASEKVQRERG